MKTVHGGLLAALALVAACSQTPRVHVDPQSGRADIDMEATGESWEEWSGDIRGIGASARISGSATARVQQSGTQAMVTLARARAGDQLPWHVHEGTCETPGGDIVGPPAAYPPVTVASNGQATAMATLPGVRLNEAADYKVNFHASSSDMGTIVACANLDD
ncbi:MAG TPA: hypothetical protein VE871_14720 [Longimicrobium sp.]|nr:hypothetical protein [Longimicrobium sp.]